MTPIYPDLKGKIVLVTGGMRGIGQTLSMGLAKQGAHVVFNYRSNPEKAHAFKMELIEQGAQNASAVCFDVTNTSSAKEELEKFTTEFGPITGLVNNAGISKDSLVLRLKEEDLEEVLNVNLKSTIMITQILTRSFLKAQDVSIVNISSVVGLMGNISQVAYAASKAGILGFTKSYAKELGSKNIRCNAICPGFIETEMTQGLKQQAKESYLDSIPLKRMGQTNEVANLVHFLLSRASSYITGEIIKVDGGLYI